MNMIFTNQFNIENTDVVSIIGCGGKTSLIEIIARENIHKKVLVSPTTKIFPLTSKNVFLCTTENNAIIHTPQIGINRLGVLDNKSGKLKALPENILPNILNKYDISLLEADGSRGLPCKGWTANEPVVPAFSTHTIGIVTLTGLGKPANEQTVLRLPEFLELTELSRDNEIDLHSLIQMACEPKGMFKNAVGKQIVFINKIECKKDSLLAIEFLQTINQLHPKKFWKLFYGSIHKKIIKEVKF